MSRPKVSKRKQQQQQPEAFEITVKKRPASSTANARSTLISHNVPHDVHNLAKQLKERLSKAMMMPASKKDDNLPCVANSASDWSSARLPSLQLLKQYLMFVAEESGTTVNIQQKDDGGHSIQISVSDKACEAAPSNSHSEVARMGARLIEAYVHGSTMESIIDSFPKSDQEEPSGSKIRYLALHNNFFSHIGFVGLLGNNPTPIPVTRRSSSDRRRTITNNNRAARQHPVADRKVEPARTARIQQRDKTTLSCRPEYSDKKPYSWGPSGSGYSDDDDGCYEDSIIKCICDRPDEEFGAMVQCDDCLCWLHLECLQLTEDALEETFRCPACFVELGGEKMVSSVTWRVAALQGSERVADTTSDEDETDDDDVLQHRLFSRLYSYQSSPSEEEEKEEDLTSMEEDFDDGVDDDEDIEMYRRDSGCSLEVVSLIDERTVQSEDSESPSEATTPEQKFRSMEAEEVHDDMVVDAESLGFLSGLVYLQESAAAAPPLRGEKPAFGQPNSTKVFHCENNGQSEVVVPNIGNLNRSRFDADTLPSSVCTTQYLEDFSFDASPFWRPAH